MFFIFGSPRSGTTLLKEVLNLNQKIYIIDETDFIAPVAHVINRVHDPIQGRDIIFRIIISTEFASSLTKFLSHNDIRELLNNCQYDLPSIINSLYHEILNRTPAILIGDKSPSYISSTYIFNQLGLFNKNFKFIHIIRDLRDVLLSIKKMSWSPKNLYIFSENWSNSNLQMSKLGLLYPEKYFFIKYEDFILDPKPILNKCCDFLDVKYDPSMMNWANCKKDVRDPTIHKNIGLPPLKNRIENWKNELLNEPKLLDYAFPGNAGLDFYGYSSDFKNSKHS